MHRLLTRLTVTCLATLFVVFLLPAASRGQASDRAIIVVELCETAPEGATDPHATSRVELGVGETKQVFAFSTMLGNPAPATAIGDGRRPDFANQWAHEWQISVTLVRVVTDAITFDLEWSHVARDGKVERKVAGDRRTVTLREGAHQVLDYLAPPDPAGRYANALIQLGVERKEDPSYATALIGYDLWLVHDCADGTQVTRHFTLTGRQGEEVAFAFDPLAFSLAAGCGDGTEGAVKIAVSVKLRGRLRPGGSIELSLESRRRVLAGGGSTGDDSGTKTFVVQPGETIGLELPPTGGYSSLPRDVRVPPKRRDGLSDVNGQASVDLKKFFAGEKTSILLSAHRAR